MDLLDRGHSVFVHHAEKPTHAEQKQKNTENEKTDKTNAIIKKHPHSKWNTQLHVIVIKFDFHLQSLQIPWLWHRGHLHCLFR